MTSFNQSTDIRNLTPPIAIATLHTILAAGAVRRYATDFTAGTGYKYLITFRCQSCIAGASGPHNEITEAARVSF